ncbi:cytochrome [Sesamum angolense]|uniref:Cytochrome n=1 Tax=Sesamum angolense TaxID=2727404 RepID=A0AAE1XHK7_9LAMI|nr:cytochrome [Sesamum angolense]
MDTSAAAIEWAFSELIRHPQVMKKLQNELETVVGLDQMVEESHLDRLEYLDFVVKETLRLHPVAPLLLPHESMEDCVIDGFHIPKGSRTMVNIWAIGRDPNVWPDPEAFKPERFIGNNIDIRGHDFRLIPFGSGRRGCPGLQLGLTVVRLVVAQLVHCFDWELPNGMLPSDLDMSEHFGLVTSRAKHLMLLKGLNSEYDNIRSRILVTEPRPSINKAYSIVLRVEKQRQIHIKDLGQVGIVCPSSKRICTCNGSIFWSGQEEGDDVTLAAMENGSDSKAVAAREKGIALLTLGDGVVALCHRSASLLLIELNKRGVVGGSLTSAFPVIEGPGTAQCLWLSPNIHISASNYFGLVVRSRSSGHSSLFFFLFSPRPSLLDVWASSKLIYLAAWARRASNLVVGFLARDLKKSPSSNHCEKALSLTSWVAIGTSKATVLKRWSELVLEKITEFLEASDHSRGRAVFSKQDKCSCESVVPSYSAMAGVRQFMNNSFAITPTVKGMPVRSSGGAPITWRFEDSSMGGLKGGRTGRSRRPAGPRWCHQTAPIDASENAQARWIDLNSLDHKMIQV